MSMKIEIGQFKSLMAQVRHINKEPLENIELYDGGQKINIDPDAIKEWRMIGLNNIDFIKTIITEKP